ncbi:Ig-like domain-containing protein [bacterium]|nr:Ig-like domain-containing protein [bacterium]
MIKRNQAKTTRSDKKIKRSNRLKNRRRLNIQGLEDRRLLAVMQDLPTAPAPDDLPEYSFARNVGAVQAFTFNESEGFLQTGLNNSIYNADQVPVGTGFGEQDTVDIFGFLPTLPGQTQTGITADLDTFAMDLRGGDILDVAVNGAATQFVVRDSFGKTVFGSVAPFAIPQAPLQDAGNATGAWVVPREGTYFLTVAPDVVSLAGGRYTIGLRAYRPITEELEVGDAQIVYLDFDGDVIDGNLLGSSGFIRIPGLAESLPLIGLESTDIAAVNEVIDGVVSQVVDVFEDLTQTGENGDFVASGNPGEYGIRVLNSRDHGGQIALNDPRLTRIFIGGNEDTIPPFGIAQTVDIGNFDMSQVAFVNFVDTAIAMADIPISPTKSLIDLAGFFIGSVAAHEAGHTLGMAHTDGSNSIGTLSDEGGTPALIYGTGIGPDLIFGTSDDIDPVFEDDFFSVTEALFIGKSEITNTLAHLLSTGTIGGGVTGRVFLDGNLDGNGSSDGGLQGVTVFADVDANGAYTVGEPTTVTTASGAFTLDVQVGTVDIRAVAPAQYLATTSTSISVTIPTSGTVPGLEFGFGIVSGVKTGVAFDDVDGDGIMDAGEMPLEGIYVYLDADGDNRPDLGETNTLTDEDGNYFFNFGNSGNYTIRAVPTPGYQVSFPTSGEHNIFFDGVAASNEYNFGFRSTLDFGDAPNSYGTSLPDGARHGIVDGLSIGTAPDRDVDGTPSIDADADDLNQIINDEDGVLQLTPLSPGNTSNFEVTITNTTGGTAYLQGFLDFNQDGDFDDAGERFLTNRTVNSGVTNVIYTVTVPVPSDAPTGDTYARFRLSRTGNLDATGFAGTGEVQDHKVTVLSGSEIANDDYFEVPRNSISVPLDVLANDFQMAGNPLTIDSLNTVGTIGIVPPPSSNQITYTPASGFIGFDTFSYTVRDQFGNTSTASVTVNVKFQSNVPIALDDIYGVPTNSVNRPLAVLDNDIASINGGLAITSVSAGTEGGVISVVAGGQSIRYTPQAGFTGTEQFLYTIQDGAGLVDQATVTVNMLPDSLTDDLLEYGIEILDATNGNPIDHVTVGDEFTVRVTVDDLRIGPVNGVTSAFLDLLYTSALVSTVDRIPNDGFDFDVEFGPLFSGSGTFQLGDASTPGLLDEVGSTQNFGDLQEHTGTAVLFQATMRANASGIAQFQGDPTDSPQAESALYGEDVALTIQQLRFNTAQLTILPSSEFVTAAVDDSFPDGLDSNGDVITNSSPNRSVLDVLDNDNLGITGTITEFDLLTNSSKGIVLVEDNGTPSDLQDDYLSYRPNTGASGLEEFSYFVVTSEGVVSSASVTLALGDQNSQAVVAFDFSLVDRSGNMLDPSLVTVGDEIGLQVTADDTRDLGLATLVYAGYLDVLYAADNLAPVEPTSGNFDFDVEFGTPAFNASAGSGTANIPGIIDEVGTLRNGTSFNFPYTNDDPKELVTIYFDVTAPGTVQFKGSPADLRPQHDTLLFLENEPVAIADIRLDVLTITISPAGSQQQNQNTNEDVNNDGFVTPIDALLVINLLGTVGEGESGGSGSANNFFPDVDGNGRVSVADALQVLSFKSSNRGEGEQLVLRANDIGTANSNSTDDVFTDLGAGDLSSTDKIAITDCPKAPEVLDPTESGTRRDAGDDEEENGLLDLLAGDVDQVWS